MPSVLHPDPFNAILLNSPALRVTPEQIEYVRKVLDRACSDSRFADKAMVAITRILTAGSVVPPVITSLSPVSAVLGSPSFTLHVIGTGFTPTSKIIWNGAEEPTTYVSATELTTGVDMSTAGTAITLPVEVLNADGVISDAKMFALTTPAALMSGLAADKTSKESEASAKLPIDRLSIDPPVEVKVKHEESHK